MLHIIARNVPSDIRNNCCCNTTYNTCKILSKPSNIYFKKKIGFGTGRD